MRCITSLLLIIPILLLSCNSSTEESVAFYCVENVEELPFDATYSDGGNLLKRCVFHIDATFEGSRFNGPDHLKRFFIETYGWKRPGYLFWIDETGKVWALWRGDIDKYVEYSEITNGARGYNRTSMHIAFSSGLKSWNKRGDTINEAQYKAAENLVCIIINAVPDIEFKGHRDLSPDLNGDGVIESFEWTKTCPNFDVETWVSKIKC